MTPETMLEILEHYRRAIGITLTGGEPLLNPWVFQLIRSAHERRMKVRIPTNGTLLSRSIDEFLAAPVDLLNISLYGVDAKTFARVTGAEGSLFDRTVEAIAELARRRRAGGYPRILQTSFICSKETMHRAIDFVRLSENLGVDQVMLHNLFYFGIPEHDESMCLHEDDPEVQDFIDDLRQQPFQIPVFLPKLYKREYKPPTCTMPFGLLSIDGDGAIGPCCIRGTGSRWGNLFDGPDVWNGPTMIQARRDLLDPARSLPPECMHCEDMIRERQSVGTLP